MILLSLHVCEQQKQTSLTAYHLSGQKSRLTTNPREKSWKDMDPSKVKAKAYIYKHSYILGRHLN